MTDQPEQSAEDVLIEFVPKLKLSQKHYARLIAAMKSYANQEVKKACKELREVEEKLHFMIDNGLGWKDMENDISPQD